MEHFIFPDEGDKKRFITLLGKGAEKYKVEVYAYCVMGNHYHLLVQTIEANLPDFMHFLCSSYASYLARREWKGHIFAGRYKAICVEKEEYFLTLQRYIHLNPVRAGISERPEQYRWSSYGCFVGRMAAPKWLKSDWMREYFGSEEQGCKDSYGGFIEEGITTDCAYPWDKVVAQSILGSDEFVKKILESQPALESEEILGRSALLKQLTLEQVTETVCDRFVLVDLKGEDASRSDVLRSARKLLIYLAKEHTSSTNRDIGESMGDISPCAIASQFTRIRRRLKEDAKFSREFSREVDEILSKTGGPNC
jgi:REP element-mobilizing transposase RayT